MKSIRQHRFGPIVPYEGFHGVNNWVGGITTALGMGMTYLQKQKAAKQAKDAAKKAQARGTGATPVSKEQLALQRAQKQTREQLGGRIGEIGRRALARGNQFQLDLEKYQTGQTDIKEKFLKFGEGGFGGGGASGAFATGIREQSGQNILAALRGEGAVDPATQRRIDEFQQQSELESQRMGLGRSSTPGIEREVAAQRYGDEASYQSRLNVLRSQYPIFSGQQGVAEREAQFKAGVLGQGYNMAPANIRYAGMAGQIEQGALQGYGTLGNLQSLSSGSLYDQQRLTSEAQIRFNAERDAATRAAQERQAGYTGTLVGQGLNYVDQLRQDRNLQKVLDAKYPKKPGSVTGTSWYNPNLVGDYGGSGSYQNLNLGGFDFTSGESGGSSGYTPKASDFSAFKR